MDADAERTTEACFARGTAMLRRLSYQKAVDSFSKAIECAPKAEKFRLLRGEAFLKLGKTREAIIDVDFLLNQNPKNCKALFMKGEILYNDSCFEDALRVFSVGHELRPNSSEFRQGIEKCREAIHNCCVFKPTNNSVDQIDYATFYKNVEKLSPEEAKPVQEKRKKKNEKEPPPKMPELDKNDKKKRAALQALNVDRVYVDSVYHAEMKRKDIEISIQSMPIDVRRKRFQNNKEAINLCISTAHFLDRRSNFWYCANPGATEAQSKSDSSTQNLPLIHADSKQGKTQPTPHWNFLVTRVNDIERKVNQGEASQVLHLTTKLLSRVEDTSHESLGVTRDQRLRLIARLHNILGRIYMSIGKLEHSSKEHVKDLKYSKYLESKIIYKRAMRNLAEVAKQSGNYYQAVEILEMKENPPKEIFVASRPSVC